ncbi:MAG TPA: ATP-binding protein [Nitrospiria bacterium]|nr:ATP-binding protein [Nitrospiria bacterium]
MKPLLRTEEYLRFPILYVDDEPLALETFRLQFKEDFTIHTSQNGEDAQRILRENEIAVILTDQRMPQTTGVELLKQVKEHHPDTVRMLMTAYSDMDVVIEAINEGNVYRYVTKPYNEDDLRNTIRQGIDTYYLIRERERLEAEKIETAKRMARANRLSAVGTLAAGMAHEINNPLTAVSAFLQMLPQKYDESSRDREYWDQFYRRVCEELDRIHNLITRMLRYSRFTGQEEYNFQETHLNELLEDMVALLVPEAKKKLNVFKKDFDPALPTGWMDQERMKQVFMNLLLNAIQATERGTITVRSRRVSQGSDRTALEVAVIDTGSGIAEEHLPKLFDPFFTTKHHEGSGLGLLTCHQIIEAHRGYIDVQSQPGKGSTFTVVIPLNPQEHDRRVSDRRNEPDEVSI